MIAVNSTDLDVVTGKSLILGQVAAVVPLLTRAAFAAAIGLPESVLLAQCGRGYWPQITIGKRVFINLEVLRSQCAAKEFS